MKFKLEYDLAGMRELAINSLNKKADEAISKDITSGSGFTALYAAKLEEAQNLLAGNGGGFPLLAASGGEIHLEAERVIAAHKKGQETLARVECARIRAKTLIAAAKRPEDITAVLENWLCY